MALDNVGVTVTGSGNAVTGGNGSSVVVQGNANVLAIGSADAIAVTGSGNTVTAGSNSSGTVTGTSDTLVLAGNDARFNLQNTGGGQDTAYLTGSNDTLGLLGGSGYVVSASNGTIDTWQNTNLTLFGNLDAVNLGSSSTLAIAGGSGIAVAGSNDVITATAGSGLAVSGNSNAIAIADGSSLILAGSGNYALAGTYDNTAIAGNNNTYSAAGPGAVTFAGTNNAADVNGTSVYTADGNPIALTGTLANAAELQQALAHSTQTADSIDEIYLEVLGRDVDATHLASYEDQIGTGATLQDVRTDVAKSGEAIDDMTATYAAIGAPGPTAEEIADFTKYMSAAYDAPITIIGSSGILAETKATDLLAELPVLETIDGGRTLSLGLPDGSTTLHFTSTERLTDFLYAAAVQETEATSFVTDTFNADVNWLNQIDQPMLQVAQNFTDLAAYNTAHGNAAQATLSNAAARIALKIAAEDPANRQSITQKISIAGHETKITVNPDTTDPYGNATFHDIDPGVLGIVETVGVAILNIAAAIAPESGLPFAAAAADAAVAGEDFANGKVLDGILSLASAAGAVAGATGFTATQQVINEAAEGVGGLYGAVQSAENGDLLGVIAGVLEAGAGIAGGLQQLKLVDPTFTQEVIQGLKTASLVVSVTDAFKEGNIASGLVSSLGPVIQGLSENRTAYQAAIDESEDERFEAYDDNVDEKLSQVAGSVNPDRPSTDIGEAANATAFEAGEASSPYGDARFAFPDDTTHYRPIYLTTPDGDAARGNANLLGIDQTQANVPLVFPEQLSPAFIADRALHDATNPNDLYPSSFDSIGRTVGSTNYEDVMGRVGIEATLFSRTPLNNFREGGIWDAQRFQGAVGAPSNVYVPAASYLIGLYGAIVGAPERVMDQINDDFFATKGFLHSLPDQPMSTNPLFPSTPQANLDNIHAAYRDVASGAYNAQLRL